ncbi:ubiquitin-specific protease [Sarracenia purpurea var. burkii]
MAEEVQYASVEPKTSTLKTSIHIAWHTSSISLPIKESGELALAFGDLLRKLWAPGRTPVAPRPFKAKLARFAPQFSGYNQHDSQKLLGEYTTWLPSSNAREGLLYKESFEKGWPSFGDPQKCGQLETGELLMRKYVRCVQVIENFSASAASRLFEQEIREVKSYVVDESDEDVEDIEEEHRP